jgi:hypothetical protein
METFVICTALIVASAAFVGLCVMGLIGEIRMLPDRIWDRFQMGYQADAQAKRESIG